MILPGKHIRFAESLIGLGAVIIDILKIKRDIDGVWFEYQKINNTRKFPAYHTYDNLVLCIDFLYALNTITIDEHGGIVRCN